MYGFVSLDLLCSILKIVGPCFGESVGTKVISLRLNNLQQIVGHKVATTLPDVFKQKGHMPPYGMILTGASLGRQC